MVQRDSVSLKTVAHAVTRRLPAAMSALAFAAVLTACGGGGGGSEVVAVTIQAQPTDETVVANGVVRFSIDATGDGLTFQWQGSTNGGTSWSDISGAINSVLELSNVTADQDGYQYRAKVSGKSGAVTSSAVTLHVSPVVVPPRFTVDLSSPAGITEGGNVSLNVTAAGTSLAYQWQSSTDGGTNWGNVSGANAATLALQAVPLTSNGTQYRVKISNTAASVTSAVATLTVSAAIDTPSFTTQPQAVSVTAPNPASFTVAGSGNPTPTVQWQISIDGGTTYTDIAGATSFTYTTGATSTSQNTNRYRAVLTNSAGTATSNAVALSVQVATVAPTITTAPANATITAGAQATFTVAASGTPTPTIQWQVSIDNGSTWTNITGATAVSYTTAVLTTADTGKRYRAVVANSASTVNSAAAGLTVTAVSPVVPVTARRMGHYYSAASSASRNGLFVKADGSVLVLGDDLIGTVTNLSGISGVSSIDGSIGAYRSGYNLLVRTDGSVFGKGWVNGLVGGLGQVGGVVGTTTISSPTAVNQLTNVSEVRVLGGSGTAVARKSDGTVWILAGSLNIVSALDVTITARQMVIPGSVNALGDTISNINGTDMVPLVMADGSVQMVTVTAADNDIPWTGKQKDYTGTGLYAGTHDATYVLSKVQGLPAIIQVSCEGSIGRNIFNPNQYHCLALTQSGAVWSWGGVNSDGQLGNGTTTASETPFQVAGLSGVIQVKAGPKISTALTQTGSVYSWGYYAYIGRSIVIGDDAYVPGKISGIPDVIQEIANGGELFARSSNGSVWAWGSYFGTPDGRPISINIPEKLPNINLN